MPRSRYLGRIRNSNDHTRDKENTAIKLKISYLAPMWADSLKMYTRWLVVLYNFQMTKFFRLDVMFLLRNIFIRFYYVDFRLTLFHRFFQKWRYFFSWWIGCRLPVIYSRSRYRISLSIREYRFCIESTRSCANSWSHHFYVLTVKFLTFGSIGCDNNQKLCKKAFIFKNE